MPLVVVAPPSAVVTLAEAKRHLRVESDDDDDAIATYLAAAQGQIDGPDGWLGRAIGVQTLELRGPDLDGDGAAWIRLPCPPVKAVLSVTYGAGVTIDPVTFVVGPGDVLRPAVGLVWPWLCSDEITVTVRYQAGYDTVPAPIKAALLLMTADLYANRGGTVDRSLVENPAIERLLGPLRVWT